MCGRGLTIGLPQNTAPGEPELEKEIASLQGSHSTTPKLQSKRAREASPSSHFRIVFFSIAIARQNRSRPPKC